MASHCLAITTTLSHREVFPVDVKSVMGNPGVEFLFVSKMCVHIGLRWQDHFVLDSYTAQHSANVIESKITFRSVRYITSRPDLVIASVKSFGVETFYCFCYQR